MPRFTEKQAQGTVAAPSEPVNGFPIKYVWHTGPWKEIFDLQIALVQEDIQRAKAEGRIVVYLSCPISSRGGGFSGTNVDVAKYIERSILGRWGEGFWILNPAQYQLESTAGHGLIDRHARTLGYDLSLLKSYASPIGGDYMRMWTTVLVSNGECVADRKLDPRFTNTAQFFDAFYFVGPTDVQSFFMKNGSTLTAGIDEYFARKFAMDADFRAAFDDLASGATPDAVAKWSRKRFEFRRYYSVRASVNFSLGSHDELLIFRAINVRRRKITEDGTAFMADGDVGEQLAGFFDGAQIDPASTEAVLSRGYSL